MDKITFFGKIDINERGVKSSDYPSWMFREHLDEMKESIEKKEREIERGLVDYADIARMRAEVVKEKEKMNAILSSKPKLSEAKENEIYKAYKEIGEKISETMFTRSDMMKGLADAHEEARRMVNPIIEIDPSIAEACKITPDKNGKVSRNDASVVYKILGAFLGDNTNVEALRKDRK